MAQGTGERRRFRRTVGKKIAAPDVTVLDDGTLPDRRGSISMMTSTSGKNTLIENGMLWDMQDRQNARLMNFPATGNGRRQSFARAHAG